MYESGQLVCVAILKGVRLTINVLYLLFLWVSTKWFWGGLSITIKKRADLKWHDLSHFSTSESLMRPSYTTNNRICNVLFKIFASSSHFIESKCD